MAESAIFLWEGTDKHAVNHTTVTIGSDRHVVCTFTQVVPEEKKVSWLLPVGIGAGAIALIALIAKGKK